MTAAAGKRALFRSRDRIRKAGEFERCHKEGKRFSSRRFVLLHLPKREGPTRLGVVVSKKTGNSVVRSRWKRVIRESFRLHRDRLPAGGDGVVIVRKSVTGMPDREAWEELLALFGKVGKR